MTMSSLNGSSGLIHSLSSSSLPSSAIFAGSHAPRGNPLGKNRYASRFTAWPRPPPVRAQSHQATVTRLRRRDHGEWHDGKSSLVRLLRRGLTVLKGVALHDGLQQGLKMVAVVFQRSDDLAHSRLVVILELAS